MSGFADALTMFLGKPVVDETDLKGDYLFTLDINADTMYAMNQNMFRGNPLPAPGGGGGQRGAGPGDVDISDALEGQLGLRLERNSKVPWELIVIDHVELPTAN